MKLALQGLRLGRAQARADRLQAATSATDAGRAAGPQPTAARLVQEQPKWQLHHLS